MRWSGKLFVVMTTATVVLISGAAAMAQGPLSAVAPGGMPGDDQTSIMYNPTTGSVDVDAPAGVGLTSINISSAGSVFTGGPAMNLDGDFDIFAADTIFKATFGSEFGTLSFGMIATTGLSEQFVLEDFTVDGSLATGGGLGDVDLIYVPEPTSLALLGLGLASIAGLAWRRRRAS